MNNEAQRPASIKEDADTNRRKFLINTGMFSAALAAAPAALALPQSEASGRGAVPQAVNKRRLGALEVSAIGLGCMSMTSESYNPPRAKAEMIPVIRQAVERGVTFFDTAEVYGPFSNEEYVGEALAPVRNQVVIASKFGFQFEQNTSTGRNSRPAHLRKAVEGMLKRLKTDRIDLLYLHRIDPEVPVEEVAEVARQFIQEGKALHFGLSETSPDTLRRAHAIQPVAALQSEYSILQRTPENQILATCEELGIGFVPWGPVCRGFLADKFDEWSRFSEESRLSQVPYFTADALQKNMALLNLVRHWSDRKGVTPAQFSLAWLLAQKPWIVPIPGTTKTHHMNENLGALEVTFSSAELKEFRTAFSAIELEGVRSPESALTDL
ncbi:aldo/keto reductase [Cellvibrio polysaccharolyticus]|uniref:Aldo/keto reductase n=1 Tax=Cellvibrio polysaccharolyticus TaxID=2082724 RepID=A0A928YTZ9_9GAMM|nr:aldo/keto reductase [Cellvibrio polysaccharolyticus]MBE8717524.1 aldo/keto reductase [Cellvibrio polysaccharolyticus]